MENTADKMGRVRGRRVTWGKGEEGKNMGRLDRRRRTGEGSLPTFWPNLHLSACSLGRSSGERSGRHSYWLRHWWGTQCLQERTTTNPQQKDLLHNVWGERYISNEACRFLWRSLNLNPSILNGLNLNPLTLLRTTSI